jgi:hypothetical protein
MADFCTLANAKAWAKVSVADDDALITSIVSSVTSEFQRYLGRDFLTASFVERYDGNDMPSLRTRQYPITAVSALTIGGVSIPLAASSEGVGYMFNDEWMFLYGFLFTRGLQNISLSYTAGYSVVPTSLDIAAREQVTYEYLKRNRIGEISRNIGGQVVSFQITEFAEGVQQVLDQFRRKM